MRDAFSILLWREFLMVSITPPNFHFLNRVSVSDRIDYILSIPFSMPIAT
jgi:hypothetical protein